MQIFKTRLFDRWANTEGLSDEALIKAFFIYGFSKTQRANISARELLALKRLASELLSYSDARLKKAVENSELIEVKDNE